MFLCCFFVQQYKELKGEGRKMGKGRGRGGGMRFGALPMLREPESLLEALELFYGELKPKDEKLAIFLTVGFFSEKKEKVLMQKE